MTSALVYCSRPAFAAERFAYSMWLPLSTAMPSLKHRPASAKSRAWNAAIPFSLRSLGAIFDLPLMVKLQKSINLLT